MKTSYRVQPEVRYVVIGDPVAHSLSPEMQNAAFISCGLAARYDKIHVLPEDIAFFAEFAALNLDGFNITVPHKRAIMPFLAGISPRAERGESVNTVIVRDGGLYGDSTDGFGLTGAVCDAFGMDLAGKNVLFIGAGGATRGVAVFLEECNVGSITLANRTMLRAEELVELLRVPAHAVALADVASLRKALRKADLIIQSTSCGLHEEDAPPFDLELLRECGACCFDMIYKDTSFLRQARDLGLPAADGCGMLLHQGAKSFEIWTGKKAPVETMRMALNEARKNKA